MTKNKNKIIAIKNNKDNKYLYRKYLFHLPISYSKIDSLTMGSENSNSTFYQSTLIMPSS